MYNLIKNSENLSRWNPALAIERMLGIQYKIISPIEIRCWNKSAQHINETIDSIMNAPYYNKEEYWGAETPTKLSLLEETMTLEDYVAMQQFINEN